jgi:hypothetical protein
MSLRSRGGADVLHDLEHLLESSWPTIAGILITAEARAWQPRF